MKTTTTVAMVGGLGASYGTFVALAGRFVYPTGSRAVTWQFATTLDNLEMGKAFHYVAPSGAEVVIARQSDEETADALIALSSVCPHLGCQVHWEAHNDRFFCPCHNGVFDPRGNPISGPPAAANQQLTRFPLKVENGLVFIEVPLETVGREEST